jgi:hypothetical protein
MTTQSDQSEPGHGRPDPSVGAIMSERRQLINLAYRLLGSLADAEDVVQETYARWYAMSQRQQAAIESAGAWLTKVASRICLDLLGSARARRERYVGEWIPEPLPDRAEWTTRPVGLHHGRPGRPSHLRRVDQHGLPRGARIDDPGRAPRVHPSRCLPLLIRGSGRDRRPYASGMSPAGLVGPPPHSRVAGLPRLGQPSRPTSSGTSRRHGKPRTSTPEQVAHLAVDVGGSVPNLTILERAVNGQPGLVVQQDGVTVAVIAFDVVGERIKHIWAVRNPEKLRPWTTG